MNQNNMNNLNFAIFLKYLFFFIGKQKKIKYYEGGNVAAETAAQTLLLVTFLEYIQHHSTVELLRGVARSTTLLVVSKHTTTN